MPTISLRLTDEEHAELKAWAHDGRRSVQKEIIWRLFTVEGAQAAKIGLAIDQRRTEVIGNELTAADSQPRDVLARTIKQDAVDPYFKPDFKRRV